MARASTDTRAWRSVRRAGLRPVVPRWDERRARLRRALIAAAAGAGVLPVDHARRPLCGTVSQTRPPGCRTPGERTAGCRVLEKRETAAPACRIPTPAATCSEPLVAVRHRNLTRRATRCDLGQGAAASRRRQARLRPRGVSQTRAALLRRGDRALSSPGRPPGPPRRRSDDVTPSQPAPATKPAEQALQELHGLDQYLLPTTTPRRPSPRSRPSDGSCGHYQTGQSCRLSTTTTVDHLHRMVRPRSCKPGTITDRASNGRPHRGNLNNLLQGRIVRTRTITGSARGWFIRISDA